MKIQVIILIALTFSLGSCSALKEANKEIERQRVLIEDLEHAKEYAPERHASDSDLDAVKHIVFFKMNDGADKDAWKKFYYLLKELSSIEYVTDLEIGKSLEGEYAEHVKMDYDMVMHMTFASEKHLAKYQQHELHQKIKENSKDFISNVWSYDFEGI